MKRFAKVVSLTLVIVMMVFTLPFGAMPVHAATYSVTFGGGTTIPGTHYATATDLSDFLILLSSGDVVDVTVVADITIYDSIKIPTGISITVKSDSSARTLLRGTGYQMDFFYILGNLTLENIVLDGNKVAMRAKQCLISVDPGGALTMNAGTVVQNNKILETRPSIAGGVYVNDGTFTMNGGSITSNEAEGGGGVVLDKYALSSLFVMTGGVISDNVATNDLGTGYGGGGVLAQEATLNISGGTITGNTALLGTPGAGIMLDTHTKGSTLNLTGNPQIGTSDTDNGVYVRAGASITTNLSTGAHINIEHIDGAAAGSVLASRPNGVTTPVSSVEAAYFHYMPGGLSVLLNVGSNAYVLGVPVSGITVTGQGGATSITTPGGTLQMLTSVLPVNATDKSVTWSVSGSAATISPSGMLTAVGNGTVTVTGTANDGSGVSGSMDVNISGQPYPFIVNFPTVTDTTQSVSGTIDADYVIDYGSGNGSSVWVNGVQLTRGQDYTDASGSVVITLLPAYLQTLSNGTYPVAVNFANGMVANTTLVVNINAVTSALPQTGDNGLPMLWIVLCGIALAGTGLWIKRRKTDTV